MAAATAAAAAAVTPDFGDLDFNIDDLDFDMFADGLDFDMAADEFCDAYSAFVANADGNNKIVGGGKAAGGWLAGLCGDDGEGGSREGSPDSGVTDGPLAGDQEAMSAFVAELERFMMEDGDGDGDLVEELISADGFFGDLQLATDSNGGVVTAAAGALRKENGEEESDDGDVLAAREDEQASRKRARHKIKGTTMTPWRGELGVTRRHLARIQVPAPWPPAAAVLLCCM